MATMTNQIYLYQSFQSLGVIHKGNP